MSATHEHPDPASPEPSLLDAVAELAAAMEQHETRLAAVERTPPPADTNHDEDAEHSGEDDEHSGDRRVRVRRRRPLRRRRRAAGHPSPGHNGSSPAVWCTEDWATFTSWVQWLRDHELHTHIPADWDEIPLVRSELRALRWAWLACERGRHPSFDWTTWHDALGRSLSRIEEWKTQHTQQLGLSGMPRSLSE